MRTPQPSINLHNISNKYILVLNKKSAQIAEYKAKINSLEKCQQLQQAVILLSEENDNLKKSIDTLQSEANKYKSLYNDVCNQLDKANHKIAELSTKIDANNLKIQIHNQEKYHISSISYEITNDILAQLTTEIDEFKHYIQSALGKTKKSTDTLIQHIKEAISSQYPYAITNIYGSHATNLCLPESDIDMVISYDSYAWNPIQLLSSIEQLLVTQGVTSTTELIKSASIPLLKLISSEHYGLVKVDISVKTKLHQGMNCIELINSYLKQFPQIEPVILAVKNMLRIAKMNNPYKGGLSSYAVVLMIVDYTQKYGVKMSSAELLLKCLYWYGYSLFPLIYPSKPNEFPKNQIVQVSSNVPTICDPLNSGNNVSKSAYNYAHIQVIL